MWGEHLMDDTLATRNASLNLGPRPAHASGHTGDERATVVQALAQREP
jgi:hypothetical protein